jgi:hypothetical protein
MSFTDVINRAETGADLPDLLARELVTHISNASAALSLGNVVPTTTRDSRVPVLTEAPEATWAASDTALRPTTAAAWTPQELIAEELSCIIPVPNAVLDDTEFDTWAAIRPLLARAAARAIDAAILFGVNPPSSWSSVSLYQDAIAAGNVGTTPATVTDDAAQALLGVAALIGADGYNPTGAVVRPGFQFRLAQGRADVTTANPASPFPLSIAGMSLYTNPPYSEPALVDAIVADWSKVLVGMRQDLRVEIFRTGVISDQDGAVVANLIQQNMSALRMTMRVGYLLAKPITDGLGGSPAGLLQPSTAGS